MFSNNNTNVTEIAQMRAEYEEKVAQMRAEYEAAVKKMNAEWAAKKAAWEAEKEERARKRAQQDAEWAASWAALEKRVADIRGESNALRKEHLLGAIKEQQLTFAANVAIGMIC